MASSSLRIVVVGGGIVGASIAYHLVRRGADVVLVEKTAPAAEASGRSFGWINASFGNPEPYYSLRVQSMLEYRRLERELEGELGVKWSGSLLWLRNVAGADLERLVRSHQSRGYPVRLVHRSECAELEPALTDPPSQAAYAESEASVDAAHATRVLLEGAARGGARIEHPCELISIDAAGGRVRSVSTSRGEIAAEAVVVAAGVATPKILASLDVRVPLVDSPSILAHAPATPGLLRRLVLSSGPHVKQDPDGTLVVGPSFERSGETDPSREAGARLLAAAKGLIGGLESVELDRVTLGWRPMPRDERPVIGFCDGTAGLYVAVMHSGVTLAPLVGRLAASELLEGIAVDLLEPYRPSRF